MKKIWFKINGETVGTCSNLKVQETRAHRSAGGSASRIRIERLDLFRTFTDNIQNNVPMRLEFETDISIWKADGAWITSYNCHNVDNDAAIHVEDLDFRCESLEYIYKHGTILSPPKYEQPKQISSSTENEEKINRIMAAVVKYMESK